MTDKLTDEEREIHIDAIRYAWLRKQFNEGLETYIGEYILSAEDLDCYIDNKIKETT